VAKPSPAILLAAARVRRRGAPSAANSSRTRRMAARGRPREAGRRPNDAEDFPGTLLPPNAHSVLGWRPRAHARPQGRPWTCGLLFAALGAPRRPHAGGVSAARYWVASALSRALAGRPVGGPAAVRDAERVAAPLARGRRVRLTHTGRVCGRCGWRDAEDFPGTLLPPNAHSVCLPHPGLVLCAHPSAAGGRHAQRQLRYQRGHGVIAAKSARSAVPWLSAHVSAYVWGKSAIGTSPHRPP